MADIVLKTLKSSGGDYDTLNAAIDGCAADLVSLDRIVHLQCWGFEDTTAVASASWNDYVMDKDHYLKIYQGGGYACSGKVANRGNEVYHHSPTVNGNPSFPVVSGMYVHVSGIWTRNAGTGAGTCVFENTTSNTLTNGGVIACESAGVVTNGSVVNFNTTVGGIEFQANACYFNGSLTTVLNAGNGLGFLHNCTMHCRLDGGTCFNAAGYSCWNCYAGETGEGEGYGGSILSKVTCAASDLTGTPAGLDEIEWTNTNFVNAEAHTDCSLTAAGDTAMGGEGTTPAEATRGYFDFGNLYIDIRGNLLNSGDGVEGWGVGCHEYGGIPPVPGTGGNDGYAEAQKQAFMALYGLG